MILLTAPVMADRNDPHYITGVAFDVPSGTWTYTYSDTAPNFPAPTQTLFRTINSNVTGQRTISPHGGSPTVYNMSGSGNSSVARLTGILTNTGDYTEFPSGAMDPGSSLTDATNYFNFINEGDWNSFIGHFLSWEFSTAGEYFVQVNSTTWQRWLGLSVGDYAQETISFSISGSTVTMSHQVGPAPGDASYVLEAMTLSNGGADYTYTQFDTGDSTDGTDVFGAHISFSDPYTSQECYDDFLALLNAWDMSDLTVANLRQDEQLANAPFCFYDEVGPVSPGPMFNPSMNDYRVGLIDDANGNAPGSHAGDSGQHDSNGLPPSDPDYSGGVDYNTTWAQMGWLDPNNYTWIWPNGSNTTMPSGFTGGATLKTPNRTGAKISHNLPGSDRHFWFGFTEFERDFIPDPFNYYEWFASSVCALSNESLPSTSLRWLSKEAAQYDGAAFRNEALPHPGNYPQAFYNQTGQVIIGCKYVQAMQKWPSVDFSRPCGAGRFAVDQYTVCAIISTGTNTYTVKATGNAIQPLAAGGIAVGNQIAVEDDGFYPVTAIHDDGEQSDGDGNEWHQYTITVGAKISDLPAGFNIGLIPSNDDIGSLDQPDYLGSLRWPTAPATCVNSDSSSKRTGVHLQYTFDQRKALAGYPSPPAWYAGVAGCLSGTFTQFTYPTGNCQTMVGIVPVHSPETWPTALMFNFPQNPTFDLLAGSHWQEAVIFTMPDPFWQQPFKPDGDIENPDALTWSEDNGSGSQDTEAINEDTGATIYNYFFPHHPLVEALTTIPAGKSLPAGVTLAFDFTQNLIPPPYYPFGISIGDADGNYANVECDWGFAMRACGGGNRFAGFYDFVACPAP